MKTVNAQTITETIAHLCIDAHRNLPKDVAAALHQAEETEPFAPAKDLLSLLTKNEQTLRLKAGAAAISGEAQCVLHIFGAKVTLSASASLGSAEAEFVYSNSSREWEFGSKLGFIAGLGFRIKISF